MPETTTGHHELERLRRQFDEVNETIVRGLAAANPHVVALVAKWDRADLVPGLSDLDYRVICDADTTADNWVEIDEAIGRVHLEMVRAHPEWNRINEHPIGAGLTLAELADERVYSPECAAWTVWWGSADWHDRMTDRLAARPFDAVDERYHLQRFMTYFSRYQRGIDPPINLGALESKYALHSRCWHYFAPPMFSAACLLARHRFGGKREALRWLADNGLVVEAVHAVLAVVDAHYEAPELTEPAALSAFEDRLYDAFEALYPAVRDASRALDVEPSLPAQELRWLLARGRSNPLAALHDSARFARIRAGRYFFYLNAPSHFAADWLLRNELAWLRKLVVPVRDALCELTGAEERCPPAETLARLGLDAPRCEVRVFEELLAVASSPADAGQADFRGTMGGVMELLPTYYRLLHRVLARLLRRPHDVRRADETAPILA